MPLQQQGPYRPGLSRQQLLRPRQTLMTHFQSALWQAQACLKAKCASHLGYLLSIHYLKLCDVLETGILLLGICARHFYGLRSHVSYFNLQDAQYFTPNAFSFRDAYYVFVGDTWNIPADDATHISFMKQASAALKAHCAGNYLNRESLTCPHAVVLLPGACVIVCIDVHLL